MASGTPVLGLGVAGARPEPDALAREVRARFGRETFAAGVHNALNRLMEVA
jgi:hypothetical protein